MIRLKNVSLKYGKTLALNNVNLTLPEHAICGLLGRNGAGKTSLLSILATYRRPTTGTLTIDGEDPYENPKVLPHIALIYNNQSETESDFKVKDIFGIAATLRPNWDAAYAERLIKLFDIPLKKTLGSLSHGMRSAVYVTIGLAGQAPITMYDEAYLGMDAAMRKLLISELLADYTERPKLILFSTHFVESYWEKSSAGRRRKYYRLKEAGKLELEEHKKQWELVYSVLSTTIYGNAERRANSDV
jgi:ABC-2 type transport system ATP-binding protein